MCHAASGNPLLEPWSAPFEAPPFDKIAPEHFAPAFEAALARHNEEIDAIIGDPEPPAFRNTIAALENSGRLLSRVSMIFWNLASAHTNDALQAVEREIAPKLALHSNAIMSNAALFRRIDDVYLRRDSLNLDPEQLRVLERTRFRFIHAGARLDETQKKRHAEIIERLARLGTQFGQNVLADEMSYALPLPAEDDRAGLPEFLLNAAASAARERGAAASHVITLSRSLIEPFLAFSPRRDLREQAFKAWAKRGENGGATDNREIVAETLELRREQAQLLGYHDFAAYKLADAMAGTPGAVRDLLERVWAPARKKAEAEKHGLQAIASAEGANIAIEPWDWRYYAEKARRAEYELDEAEIKAHLPLEGVIEAAFWTAGRLFGLNFNERHDAPVYHPDVRAWEITGPSGEPVGLFLGDYYARPSKRSGAWMSAYRRQEKLAGDVRPIIVNVMNFARAPDGAPTLLSMDDARTLFHEFGHALHGLLSDVTYPSLAGTSVATDFVEFPSQLYEHWLLTPDVLSRFARHVETGEPMPQALIGKIRAAHTFNQGFATVEFLASAIVDIDFHSHLYEPGADPLEFERRTLERIGMPKEIVMRHRTPHFQHVFSGDAYSAGYYSYMWSEVLDADAFAAFKEAGDAFDPGLAERLKKYVYSAGALRREADAYLAFRGRAPSVEGLLRKRGLDGA
jgi:peptidyl-dipeptidase Dcp